MQGNIEAHKVVVDLEVDLIRKENQIPENMVLDDCVVREGIDKSGKGSLNSKDGNTIDAMSRIQVSESKPGRKNQWRRSLRTKRVPLKDITDRGTESNIGEKRKT